MKFSNQTYKQNYSQHYKNTSQLHWWRSNNMRDVCKPRRSQKTGHGGRPRFYVVVKWWIKCIWSLLIHCSESSTRTIQCSQIWPWWLSISTDFFFFYFFFLKQVISRAKNYKKLLLTIQAGYEDIIVALQKKEAETRMAKLTLAASTSHPKSVIACWRRATQLKQRCSECENTTVDVFDYTLTALFSLSRARICHLQRETRGLQDKIHKQKLWRDQRMWIPGMTDICIDAWKQHNLLLSPTSHYTSTWIQLGTSGPRGPRDLELTWNQKTNKLTIKIIRPVRNVTCQSCTMSRKLQNTILSNNYK